MRQRVLIAVAIASQPKVLLADEPTTALDVIIQDQILSLLLELQRDFGMSMILVSHDLGVIAEMCDRIAVMYAGQIVELTDARTLLTAPRHPYTISLLRSLPDSENRTRYLPSIVGTPPQLIDIEPGCRFAPRCALAKTECQTWDTELIAVGEEHLVRCWRHDERKEAPGMAGAELRVGVIGTGRWAKMAHLPGWSRDSRGRARCSVRRGRGGWPKTAAREFGVAEHTTDYRRLLERDDIDVIDVVTGDSGHFELTMAALEAGKHVLVEKPVAHDFRDTLRARDLAASKGLKTKVGFTFRYSPAIRYMQRADRAGLGRDAVHLQRVRAELAVDRARNAAAPGSGRVRPGAASASRRSRATALRSSISATGSWRPTSRRSSACCATSCPSG